jgi:hypothetical protein
MLLSAAVLLILPLAASAGNSAECASACQTPLSELSFDGSPATAGYYTLTCTNLLLVQSTFLCMRYYCSEVEITDGLVSLDSACQAYGSVGILPWSIIKNITNEQLLAWPHISYDDLHGPIPYDTPVFISRPLFDASLLTMVAITPL